MTIKETVCTEIDERGRVIKHTRTVDIYESERDRVYDYITRNRYDGNFREASLGRIMEAYDDYRKSNQW